MPQVLDVNRRIADLQNRIAARDGKPGYKRNVAALKAELAKLQKDIATQAVESSSRTEPTQESVAEEPGLTAEAPAA